MKTENIKPVETKQEAKPEVKKNAPKKDSAVVHGWDLPISTKQSMDVCSMIRGMTIEKALSMLNEVLLFKRVVHMNKREMPHQHGKGVMAGRFPQNTCMEFIRLVKQLQANAIVNGLEIEKCVISCKADFASRPYRRGGTKFKRTNLLLMLKENKKMSEKNKTEKNK